MLSVRSILRKYYLNLKLKGKFEQQAKQYAESNPTRFPIYSANYYPILNEATPNTDFDRHYIYHPAWAARVLKHINPTKHIDVSSVLSFCSIVSAFIQTEFYDYRPADLSMSGLFCGKADLTNLHFDDNSIESLSCMHTVEHIGLGRYGDPIDPDADMKAISELKRVVKPGGSLLFVVPVGVPKLQFNAHRIYSYEMVQEQFQGFEVKEFSLLTDQGQFVQNADSALVARQHYGCGCFWLIKGK